MKLTRRQLFQTAGVVAASSWLSARGGEARGDADAVNANVDYGQRTLPRGIRSRHIDTNNDVVLHILEAGFEEPNRPCVVLLHGFPELAYTWRNQLLPLAAAGFHVVAPDARGSGRSVSKPVAFDDSLAPYSTVNRVADVLGLVRALGYEKVAAVVGHDWGGPTAQWCARLRPDVFRSVVSLSTPFLGAPRLPLNTADRPPGGPSVDINKALAALPRPRKHYAWYSTLKEANEDVRHAPQGLHDYFREFFYFKSGDWEGNNPHPLKGWTAAEVATMPTYYVMDLSKGFAATAAEHMPSPAYIAGCRWMTEADIGVYAKEFQRTGFQGGLNYYRIDGVFGIDSGLSAFSGKKIDVPACYIGGAKEWAVYQTPGAFEEMHLACTKLRSVHLVAGAGHSLAEEKPAEVNKILMEFITRQRHA